MSGIEVVLIVGAGILITKKVQQHRREKKLKELADAGLLPEQHAPAQVVRQQKTSAEDEALPQYSPPSKEYVSGHLPSYDEARKNNSQLSDRSQVTSQSQPQPQTQNTSTTGKKPSRKWKLWKRDKEVDRAVPEQTDQGRPAPATLSQ